MTKKSRDKPSTTLIISPTTPNFVKKTPINPAMNPITISSNIIRIKLIKRLKKLRVAADRPNLNASNGGTSSKATSAAANSIPLPKITVYTIAQRMRGIITPIFKESNPYKRKN